MEMDLLRSEVFLNEFMSILYLVSEFGLAYCFYAVSRYRSDFKS